MDFIPNWTNKFKSKDEALAHAIGSVLSTVPKSSIIYQGEVFESAIKKSPKVKDKNV